MGAGAEAGVCATVAGAGAGACATGGAIVGGLLAGQKNIPSATSTTTASKAHSQRVMAYPAHCFEFFSNGKVNLRPKRLFRLRFVEDMTTNERWRMSTAR